MRFHGLVFFLMVVLFLIAGCSQPARRAGANDEVSESIPLPADADRMNMQEQAHLINAGLYRRKDGQIVPLNKPGSGKSWSAPARVAAPPSQPDEEQEAVTPSVDSVKVRLPEWMP